MTVGGMLICFRITVMIVPVLILVFDWTIGGNGIIQDFRMVMMRYQIVSQEY
jgi:hypothetical protein